MNENLDRKTLILMGSAAASVILFIGSLVWSGTASSRLSEIRKAYAEMSSVGAELKGLMGQVESMERRAAASGDKGLLTFIDQITETIGIKQKLISQKSAPSSSAREEKAELSFEKLTLNEAVNLLYRIDSMPVLLLVNRVEMAPSFEKPDLIVLDMTISLIKAGNED